LATDGNAAARKRQEARLRRTAASMGLVVRKSRARDDCRMDYGCFRIENKDGAALSGTYPYPYSLTLEAAEEALEMLAESPLELARDERGNLIHGTAGAADLQWGR
jgi:hypothetical protein